MGRPGLGALRCGLPGRWVAHDLLPASPFVQVAEMMTEISGEWRAVPTHQGYLASRDGRIKGPSGKVLRPMPNPSGHLYVLTPFPRRPRKLFVHRAVLLAFVGPCPDGLNTRHLNGKPQDNRLENLAWGTPQDQADDKRLHGTQKRGIETGSAKLTEAQVVEIRRRIKTESTRALGREFGVSHTAIRRAGNGMKWAHLKETTL